MLWVMMKFAFLFILVLSHSALAQTQSEMNAQAHADAAKADAQLNRVYKQVLATQDDEGKRLLKEAQRAWVLFRDAESASAADEARGGSMAPLLEFGAKARLTEERIKQLKERLGEEGDGPEPVIVLPTGAKSAKAAAQALFNAYRDHNRPAASAVALERVLSQLTWDPSAGNAEGLELADDTHIRYTGGSMELTPRKAPNGAWFIVDIQFTAD
jgi:uncharacterized protein YecT (DUF1311 family)